MKLLHTEPHIAIIGRLTHLGGVQSVILSLIKGLNARGITPDLIWDIPPNPDMLSEKGLRAGYETVRFTVPSRTLDRMSITTRYLFRTVNIINTRQIPRQYDFYYVFYNGFLTDQSTPHVYYLSGPPLIPQLEAVRPGLRGVPFRMTDWFYRHFLSRRFPYYEYHPNARYVINSGFTAELFEKAHSVRLPVVYPPINLHERSFTAGDLARRDTITFFSRFADYKRPEMVLQLAACYPTHRVVLMGGVRPEARPFFESLVSEAQNDGLTNVIFYDNPSDEIVSEELARTRFFIFPTIMEHFGMATAEAIASGAVPFVHDSGGQREIVPDPRLRFTDDRFQAQFADVMALPEGELNNIRFQLRDHINRYSEEAFITQMLAFANL